MELNDIIDFLLGLLRDPAAAAAFEQDPQAALQGAGLQDATGQDVRDAQLLLADSGAARPDPGSSQHAGGDAVREISYTTQHFEAAPVSAGPVTTITIDDRDIVIRDSFNSDDDDITLIDDSFNDVAVDNSVVDNSVDNSSVENDVVAIQDNDVTTVVAVEDNDTINEAAAPAAAEPADAAPEVGIEVGTEEAPAEPVFEADPVPDSDLDATDEAAGFVVA